MYQSDVYIQRSVPCYYILSTKRKHPLGKTFRARMYILLSVETDKLIRPSGKPGHLFLPPANKDEQKIYTIISTRFPFAGGEQRKRNSHLLLYIYPHKTPRTCAFLLSLCTITEPNLEQQRLVVNRAHTHTHFRIISYTGASCSCPDSRRRARAQLPPIFPPRADAKSMLARACMCMMNVWVR